MQEWTEDIAECLRAISANPPDAELRRALGDKLFLMGRFGAPLANYRKAREIAFGRSIGVTRSGREWVFASGRPERCRALAATLMR